MVKYILPNIAALLLVVPAPAASVTTIVGRSRSITTSSSRCAPPFSSSGYVNVNGKQKNKKLILRSTTKMQAIGSTGANGDDKQQRAGISTKAAVTSPKDTTISKLEAQLAKQRLDVRETELLLETLKFKSKHATKGEGGVVEQEQTYFNVSPYERSILSAENYGFVSRSEGSRYGADSTLQDGVDGVFEGYAPPANILRLAAEGFQRNFGAIFGKYEEERKLTPRQVELQGKLGQLTLNTTAVWEREGEVSGPLILKVPYTILCYLLDVVFEGRYMPNRFFLLETVARVPYFSYISMLHLYESLGWWRRSSDVKRVHFSEEWNEFHHLLIMESLGGDQTWWVRFLAQHAAIVYYWTLILLWVISPSLGYKFSEMLETHAVETYSQFVEENEELLRELPPPLEAVNYYCLGVDDPLFNDYQTSSRTGDGEPRQLGVDMTSLYEVFRTIRDDEGEHVNTMQACLDSNVAVVAPSVEKKVLFGAALIASIGYLASTNDISDIDTLMETISEGMSAISVPEPILAEVESMKDVAEETVTAIATDEDLKEELTTAAIVERAAFSFGVEELKKLLADLFKFL